MIENQSILSASVVKEGGIAAAVAKMAFGNRLGVRLETMRDPLTLFAPVSGSLVVELAADAGLPAEAFLVGTVTEAPEIVLDGATLPLDDLACRLGLHTGKGIPHPGKGGTVERGNSALRRTLR